MKYPFILVTSLLCATSSAATNPAQRPHLVTLLEANEPLRIQADETTSLTLIPQKQSTYDDLDARVVTGKVRGNGSFVIAHGPTGIEGCIWTESGTWTISMLHNDDLTQPLQLSTFDPNTIVPCLGGITPDTPYPDQHPAVQPLDERNTRGAIDPTRVLVVYNEDARDDVSDINAYIIGMIASANQAYANSETDNVQIQLAGAYLLDESFSDDFSEVLRQATNRYDGVGDTMHTLRNATDADVIAMLVDQPGFCGLAWRAPGNAEYAFSVSDTDCALTNLTFAHELGHNQGCTHDPDNAGSATTSYGYGHRWSNNQWRSVMAYSPGSRVPYFSNPDVMFGGAPTGIANERDNARLLDETRDEMSILRIGDGTGIDTDNNSTPDRLDIALDPSLDLDKDRQLDSAQIAADPSLDCNADGQLDSEQLNPRVRVMLGSTTEFGDGIFNNFTTDPLPEAASDVEIQFGILGDVGSSSERIEFVFNSGLYSGNVFANNGSDCYSPGLLETVTASPEQFEQILAQGVNLVITGSSSVDFDACSYPSLAVWIEYRTTNSSLDSNGDGIIDSCACTADLNGDGQLNFFDVSEFLTLYNAQSPAADLNNDGLFNFFDVSAFLTAYNEGCP